MDFHRYPIDTQQCSLQIESFGYTADDILYRWSGGIKMSSYARQMPERDIIDVRHTEDILDYPLGDWSSLKITFVVRRHLFYYFLHMYLPCCIVVVLAWMSLFIPKVSSQRFNLNDYFLCPFYGYSAEPVPLNNS